MQEATLDTDSDDWEDQTGLRNHFLYCAQLTPKLDKMAIELQPALTCMRALRLLVRSPDAAVTRGENSP